MLNMREVLEVLRVLGRFRRHWKILEVLKSTGKCWKSVEVLKSTGGTEKYWRYWKILEVLKSTGRYWKLVDVLKSIEGTGKYLSCCWKAREIQEVLCYSHPAVASASAQTRVLPPFTEWGEAMPMAAKGADEIRPLLE